MSKKPMFGHEYPAITRYGYTIWPEINFGDVINRPIVATSPSPFSQWDDIPSTIPEASCEVTKQVISPRSYWIKWTSTDGLNPCYVLGSRRISLYSLGKDTTLTMTATFDGYRTPDPNDEAAVVMFGTWPPHRVQSEYTGDWNFYSTYGSIDLLSGETVLSLPDYFYRYTVDLTIIRVVFDRAPDRIPWIKLDMDIT